MSEQRIFWDYEEHLGTILAKAAVTMANIAYNMGRLRWLRGRAKPPPDGLVCT